MYCVRVCVLCVCEQVCVRKQFVYANCIDYQRFVGVDSICVCLSVTVSSWPRLRVSVTTYLGVTLLLSMFLFYLCFYGVCRCVFFCLCASQYVSVYLVRLYARLYVFVWFGVFPCAVGGE